MNGCGSSERGIEKQFRTDGWHGVGDLVLSAASPTTQRPGLAGHGIGVKVGTAKQKVLFFSARVWFKELDASVG